MTRGRRPTEEEDPLNAIVRRCRVRGATAGPLAGKRVGLKDNISVAGIPMTCGSAVVEFVPDTDATVVTRLLDAGAEIVAILNMDNFAFSGAGDTSAYGPIRNPHHPSRLAGGSSGGSAAALAYADIDFTIGADQGGSVRIPASWCGVVGLKPTHGLVPIRASSGSTTPSIMPVCWRARRPRWRKLLRLQLVGIRTTRANARFAWSTIPRH